MRVAAALVVLVAIYLAPTSLTRLIVGAEPGISTVGTESLATVVQDGKGKVTLILVNAGDKQRVTWSVQLATGPDGAPRTAKVQPESTDVESRSTVIAELAIVEVSATGKLSGVLTGTPEAGAPVARAISVSNFGLTFPFEAWYVVAAAMVGSLVLVVVRFVTGGYDKAEINNPKWDFGTSWATTITGVGALLATVIAAGALPAEPYLLSKAEISGLSLLFAGLVVLAPIVYKALKRDSGTVGLFHVAALFTSVGVTGQLMCVTFLLVDTIGQRGPSGLIWGLIAVGASALFLVTVYVWRTIPLTIKEGQKPGDTLDRQVAQPPSWSLL